MAEHQEPPFAMETTDDRAPEVEVTDWGEAQRLHSPGRIAGTTMHWRGPARNLGSDLPNWSASNEI
jgi:hypothetical protein